MRTFLISYDLAQPNANKNAINSAIMMLGQSWARPLGVDLVHPRRHRRR